jgi:hypothetical protein
MVPPLTLEGQIVSSTAIRTLLSAGAVRGAADLLGRPYGVIGEITGDDLLVDPLRTLPRGMVYDAQLRQDNKTHDVSVTVLNAPNRIHLDSDVPHHDGPAAIDFLRRTD